MIEPYARDLCVNPLMVLVMPPYMCISTPFPACSLRRLMPYEIAWAGKMHSYFVCLPDILPHFRGKPGSEERLELSPRWWHLRREAPHPSDSMILSHSGKSLCELQSLQSLYKYISNTV